MKNRNNKQQPSIIEKTLLIIICIMIIAIILGPLTHAAYALPSSMKSIESFIVGMLFVALPIFFTIWLFQKSDQASKKRQKLQEAKLAEQQEQVRHKFSSLSKEQRQFELENYMHDLRKAQSTAAWSYIGLVIPLIGWILAGISNSSLKSIPVGISDSMDRRVRGTRSNISASITLSILVVLIYIFVSAFNSGAASTQNTATTPTTTTDTTTNNIQNLQAQNACIANAQSQVDNDPMYQPVGGDPESVSLSQQSKALAMQPKIDGCKTEYPTN